MKRWIALTAVVLSVALTCGTGLAAPPGKVVISEIQKMKTPVAFDHKAHGERVKACKTCHHQDEAGKERKCSTAACHGAKAEGKKVALKNAFHKQCTGCHKEGKKGPTKCKECHSK